jgi:hypothetical protein
LGCDVRRFLRDGTAVREAEWATNRRHDTHHRRRGDLGDAAYDTAPAAADIVKTSLLSTAAETKCGSDQARSELEERCPAATVTASRTTQTQTDHVARKARPVPLCQVIEDTWRRAPRCEELERRAEGVSESKGREHLTKVAVASTYAGYPARSRSPDSPDGLARPITEAHGNLPAHADGHRRLPTRFTEEL